MSVNSGSKRAFLSGIRTKKSRRHKGGKETVKKCEGDAQKHPYAPRPQPPGVEKTRERRRRKEQRAKL